MIGLGRYVLGQVGPMGVRKSLGQWGELATIASGLLQAGSAAYGAHMQQQITKMQIKTQKEIQAKQEAAAAAAAKAEADAAAGVTGASGAPGTPGAPGAKSTILGIDQTVFIAGGVGLALMLGVVAVVASKSSSQPVQQSTRAA